MPYKIGDAAKKINNQGNNQLYTPPVNYESSGNTPVVPKKQNYINSVIGDYTKAGQNIVSGIEKSAQQVEEGKQQGGVGGLLKSAGGLLRGGLRTVGGVAEATFAPITEIPIVKSLLNTIGKGVQKIPGVEEVINKIDELSAKYPESSKDIKNVIDIATLFGGKKAEKVSGQTMEKTGLALEKSGNIASDIAKGKSAAELIKPIETKATKLAQVPRTTEVGGLFKKDIIIPTTIEKKMAEEVSKIPEIFNKNTFQKKFNLIKDYNITQAQQLEQDIVNNNFLIPRREIISKLNVAAKELKSSPLLVGDAEKTAQKLISGARNIIDKNPGTGSGLLNARKEFDNWVLSQKPKAFDATADNAFTVANRSIRNTINDILEKNAPNVGVKESLKRQSLLYRAMENIAPKAAEEANTVFKRTLQRVGRILGTKNRIVQGVAAAAGIGGLGAAATFATPAVIIGGLGYITYRAGKLIMKPELRIAVGKLLQQAGHLLNPADKKVLEDILKNTE